MVSDNDPLFEINKIYTDPNALIDVAKMYASLMEKLVVLDGATIAASLTAFSIFRQHIVGDGGIGFLTAAWKLLFVGIVFALLAQFFAVEQSGRVAQLFSSMRILQLLERAENLGMDSSDFDASRRAIVKKYPAMSKTLHRHSTMSRWFGAIALSTSFAAFYWLYRFISVNASAR